MKSALAAPSAAPIPEEVFAAVATLLAYVNGARETTRADSLVRIESKALATYGLELRGILSLVGAGRLKVVRIGRARFTTLSRLVALVDELEAAPNPKREAPKNDLEIAVARAATRRSRRAA